MIDYHHMPLPWPADLQAICRNDCAARGEPPCWEVDARMEPHHAGYAMRGRVCDGCYRMWLAGHPPVNLRRCAERELHQRRRVYARRVAEGKMTQQEADREIARMTAIWAYFRDLEDQGRLL